MAQAMGSLSVGKDEAVKTGSIYYSSNKKNELTMRTNIWGAVQFPGVHYIPIGTRFLDAISVAGGPVDLADLSSVTLSSHQSDTGKEAMVRTISLSKALSHPEFNPVLKADDVILVKLDRSYEKTQLWLSVGTFVLSAAAFGLLLDQQNKK